MSEPGILKQPRPTGLDTGAICGLIIDTQKVSGEIPWSTGDKTDPWDHVESAMGLNIGGCHEAARRAFDWSAAGQLDDGSWYSSYRDGRPEDRTRDTNMSSYIAVGVYHDFLIRGDKAFVRRMWPVVEKAIEFALSFQAPSGEIHWAVSPEGIKDPVALLTGSSSVYMSIKCALAAAGHIGLERLKWRAALAALGNAIAHHPERFNMTKARYSMDWFYPVLAGAVQGQEAQRRIEKSWDKFVVKGQGVRCVSDQPWVTLAETSELVLALAAMGNRRLAGIVFNWIQDKTFDDGTYHCGFTVPDLVVWPEDKITWTNAVVLMAADSLYGLTPAGRLFHHDFWSETGF